MELVKTVRPFFRNSAVAASYVLLESGRVLWIEEKDGWVLQRRSDASTCLGIQKKERLLQPYEQNVITPKSRLVFCSKEGISIDENIVSYVAPLPIDFLREVEIESRGSCSSYAVLSDGTIHGWREKTKPWSKPPYGISRIVNLTIEDIFIPYRREIPLGMTLVLKNAGRVEPGGAVISVKVLDAFKYYAAYSND